MHARPLAAHRLWRHHRNFALDQDDHLMPGELRLRQAGYWVAARIIRFWVRQQGLSGELEGLGRIHWRHLLGDFRPERKAHLTEQTSVSYKTGFDDGMRYVQAELERRFINQEFPIR